MLSSAMSPDSKVIEESTSCIESVRPYSPLPPPLKI